MKTPTAMVAIQVLLLSAAVAPTSAVTSVCGPIDSDTTWTLAGSPYLVTCSIIVRNGATLTIEPGVQVRFQTGTTLWIGTVSLGGGELIADAQSGDPILLTSAQPSPKPGDWTGISLLPSAVGTVLSGNEYVSGSILRNCIIEYARGDAGASLETSTNLGLFGTVVRYGQRAGVWCFYPSTLLVVNCAVHDNREYGIVASGQTNRIVGTTVAGNGTTGVSAGFSTTIDYCHIERNGGTGGGSGIFGSGEFLLVEHTTISQNGHPSNGGGIINGMHALTVRCSSIEGNIATAPNAAGIDVREPTQSFELSMTNLANAGINLRNSTLLTLDARSNWWGTTDASQVENGVFHCFDSPYVGCVEFQPFLLAPEAPLTCGGTVAARPIVWGRLKAMYR